MGSSEPQSNSPAIQTGEAFDVVHSKSEYSSSDLTDKSAEDLIHEADQIVIATNGLIAKQGLSQTAMTTEQREEIEVNIGDLEQRIIELEQQLQE